MKKDVDKEIAILRKRLEKLQASKRRADRAVIALDKKPKGRPRIANEVIVRAKKLAFEFPLPDVALTLGVSLQTLYRYGIKRYLLDAEKKRRQTSLSA